MKISTGTNSSQRIVFLVPGDQSGPCGVTDYSLWLVRAAAERGHQVLVLSLYPFRPRPFMAEVSTSAGGSITTQLPSKSPPAPEEIAQALASFDPNLVIFQFSPPVFRTGKRIYPYLSRICHVLRSYEVFLVAHETWTSSETRPSLRRFILHGFRRFEILAAWKLLQIRHVYASNPRHLDQLQSAGFKPHHLPIFSNIPHSPRPLHHRAALNNLLNTRGHSAFLSGSPYIAIFFGRIPDAWDPSQVLHQIQQESRNCARDLCLISIGETGYSDQGWQRVVQTAGTIPSLRLGKSSPEEIVALLHAADCGITPNALEFWLKSGTCAAMIGCELPIVFSQTNIPPEISLPPHFATLGRQRLDWHQPSADRVIQIPSPLINWQRLEKDLFSTATSAGSPPDHSV